MSAIAPPPTRRARALQHEVLRVVVGSTLNGLDLPGSDRDEVGVFIDTPEDALGVVDYDATIIVRDAAPNQRSRAGQTDLTLYSLRHFLSLAAKGNPSLLAVLWAPPEFVIKRNGIIAPHLVGWREAFVTVEAGKRFLGYLDSQVARLRGQRGGSPNRPELVARHGYDTKFASHAARLGMQGVELMRYGRMTLPMRTDQRQRVLAIKRGEVPFEEAMDIIEGVRASLVTALRNPGYMVRDSADFERISMWSATVHRLYWEEIRA